MSAPIRCRRRVWLGFASAGENGPPVSAAFSFGCSAPARSAASAPFRSCSVLVGALASGHGRQPKRRPEQLLPVDRQHLPATLSFALTHDRRPSEDTGSRRHGVDRRRADYRASGSCPVQPLSTLRTPRRRDVRKTSLPSRLLGFERTRLSLASSFQLSSRTRIRLS